jgi:hypothetical protein
MLPNFLIVGAPRSGTTLLYEGLRKHPEVYMSLVKEPLFLSGYGEMKRMEEYQGLFAGVTTEKLVGEASTLYLYSPEAPARIAQSLPDVKLIAILRNPVDRAYSNYLHHVRAGFEDLGFAEALAVEEDRIRAGRSPFLYYRDLGFYGQQIERYRAIFDRSQMQFLLYEDIQTDPAEVFRVVFRFLGVDDSFPVDTSVKYNPSGVPTHSCLHQLVTGPSAVKTALKAILPENLQERLLLRVLNLTLSKPPLDPEIRQRLVSGYRQDILKTQELIGRDLSTWLEA